MCESATPLNLVKKIIILNGPPGCGKDLAANALLHYMKHHALWLQAVHEKFSYNMKKAVLAVYGVFESVEYIDINQLKDTPHKDMLGRTPRQAYIEMFQHLERMHGDNVLGKLMEHHLRRNYKIGLHIFSDGGRLGDVIPIVEYVHPRSVLFLEIHASGKTFDGDIRSYLGQELKNRYPKITYQRIENTFSDDPLDKLIFRGCVIGMAKRFLGLEDEE